MDPLKERLTEIRMALAMGAWREDGSPGGGMTGVGCAGLVADIDDLLASPVPPPSADARAKLEQAHARWKAAKEADYADPTVRTRLALEAAEHDLSHLALPPHEGETPRSDSGESTGTPRPIELTREWNRGWEKGRAFGSTEIERWKARASKLEDAAFHFLTCRLCAEDPDGCENGRKFQAYMNGGETPQPAAELEDMRQRKDQAYAERNAMVAALSKLWPSHLAMHPESDEMWERDWMTIVCIHSPMGQLTWHLHDTQVADFAHLSMGEGHWDGHTTPEKYARLAALPPVVQTRPEDQ